MLTSTGLTSPCWSVNLAMNPFVAQIPIRSSMIMTGSVSMAASFWVPTSTTIPVNNTPSQTGTSSAASAMRCLTVGDDYCLTVANRFLLRKRNARYVSFRRLITSLVSMTTLAWVVSALRSRKMQSLLIVIARFVFLL